MTLANKITTLRILSIPIFVLLLIYYTLSVKQGEANELYRLIALVLFLAVALTDALDGYFARSRNEITRLGRILDPIADKALLISALILLTRPSLPELQPQFPIFFTLVVISRDLVLIAGAVIIHGICGTVEIQPHMTGKIATVMQMLVIVWALAALPVGPFTGLVWTAGVFTLISGLYYLVDGVKQLDKSSAEHKQG